MLLLRVQPLLARLFFAHDALVLCLPVYPSINTTWVVWRLFAVGIVRENLHPFIFVCDYYGCGTVAVGTVRGNFPASIKWTVLQLIALGRSFLFQVADVWDVLQRQREIQRREAEEQPDADLEDSPDNGFPVALVRRLVSERVKGLERD